MHRWRRTAAVVVASFRYGAIRTTLYGNDGKTRAPFVSTPPKPRLAATEPHERRRASASVDEPARFLSRPPRPFPRFRPFLFLLAFTLPPHDCALYVFPSIAPFDIHRSIHRSTQIDRTVRYSPVIGRP